jgi:hypothetical protein
MKLLFLLVLFFLQITSFAMPQPACKKKCCSAFGKILGISEGVIAYSNCNNAFESNQWQKISIFDKEFITGMKWQCVEYARRWLMLKKGYSFDSIDHAFQIWKLSHAISLNNNAHISWLKFANGKTKFAPQAGDLLIYDTTQGVHGHVSVIVGLVADKVLIGEQNYNNSKWVNQSYARTVKLIKNNKGFFSLKDQGVIGWMRVSSHQEI